MLLSMFHNKNFTKFLCSFGCPVNIGFFCLIHGNNQAAGRAEDTRTAESLGGAVVRQRNHDERANVNETEAWNVERGVCEV